MNEKDIIVFWSDTDWGLKYFGSNVRVKNCSFKRRKYAETYAKKIIIVGARIFLLNKDCRIDKII